MFGVSSVVCVCLSEIRECENMDTDVPDARPDGKSLGSIRAAKCAAPLCGSKT